MKSSFPTVYVGVIYLSCYLFLCYFATFISLISNHQYRTQEHITTIIYCALFQISQWESPLNDYTSQALPFFGQGIVLSGFVYRFSPKMLPRRSVAFVQDYDEGIEICGFFWLPDTLIEIRRNFCHTAKESRNFSTPVHKGQVPADNFP